MILGEIRWVLFQGITDQFLQIKFPAKDKGFGKNPSTDDLSLVISQNSVGFDDGIAIFQFKDWPENKNAPGKGILHIRG